MTIVSFTEIYLIILIFLIIFYSFGILYLKRGFRKYYRRSADNNPSVSIIVSMHNEEKNATACLESLVRQEYPRDKLEIIIVNDRSTDHTGDIIDKFCQAHSLIRQITIQHKSELFAPKKFAIDQAIKKSRGKIILLTDADGRPGSQWVMQMITCFTDEVGMVIGYAPYTSETKIPSIWNRLLSLEYLSHASIAAASTGIGFPVTCVGTNMAYKKFVYEQLEGFGIYKNVHTGDDDLFLQRVRDESNWGIVYSTQRESQVANAAPAEWKKFYQQRLRYASKGFKYPIHIIGILVFFYIINLLLLITPLSFIYCTSCILPFFAAVILKAVSDYGFLKTASSVLNDKRYLNLFPVAFILHIPYVVFFGLISQFRSFKWADHTN